MITLPFILGYLVFGKIATNIRDRIKLLIMFLLPCAAIALIWVLHTHALIGQFIDLPLNAVYTKTSGSNLSSLHNPTGLASLPHISTIIMLPVLPILTAIFGNQEPFGNRTG